MAGEGSSERERDLSEAGAATTVSPGEVLREGGGLGARSRVRVSAVVPCHNEAACLAELHRRLSAVLGETTCDEYEIVLVNDGSSDETWPAIRTLTVVDAHVVGVDLARNHGHQTALAAGLAFATGERVFILDADLQDPPELLPEMLRLMDEGADVVYGQRAVRKGETWLKRQTAAAFYRMLSRLSETEIPRNAGDFRLLSRRVVDVLNAMPEHHRFVRGMVAWIGYRQVALPYERDRRYAGTTSYPWVSMIKLAIDGVTSFSVKPLRLASYVGLLVTAGALCVLVFAIVSAVFLPTVPGWTSIMIIVLVIGAVQLLTLGVIGEYVGRLVVESRGRPLFVVREVCSGPVRGDVARKAESASDTVVSQG